MKFIPFLRFSFFGPFFLFVKEKKGQKNMPYKFLLASM